MKPTLPFPLTLVFTFFALLNTSTSYTQIIKPSPAIEIIRDSECKLLTVNLKKQDRGEGPCCYKIFLTNKLTGRARIFPAEFQVSIKNGNITHVYGKQSPWQQTPVAVPPLTKKVSWKQPAKIPVGQTEVATICVEGKSPIWLYNSWLDRTGKTLCQDSLKLRVPQ
ncbi:MAG: hypothetical protein IPN33_22190 [Saprospiraceae bacterium]|nr:hypothetical protein [Saprospiraceae bacterium]